MGERLTPIIFSSEVNRDPRKLVDYLKESPQMKDIYQSLSRRVADNRKTLILRQYDEGYDMLDGSHRLLAMVLGGETVFQSYVARLEDTTAQPAIGDAFFIRLRQLWRQTDDPAYRQAIEATIQGAMKQTRDGRDAVKSYWVTMAPNEEIEQAGERLLNN